MISDLFTKGIKEADPEVYGTLSRELERQQNQIELIASENIASRSILNAQGSVMTINMQKGILVNDIMVGVNLLIKLKRLL